MVQKISSQVRQQDKYVYQVPSNDHQNYLPNMLPCIFSPMNAPINYLVRSPQSPMMRFQQINGYGDFSNTINNIGLIQPSQLIKKDEERQFPFSTSSFSFMHDYQGK